MSLGFPEMATQRRVSERLQALSVSQPISQVNAQISQTHNSQLRRYHAGAAATDYDAALLGRPVTPRVSRVTAPLLCKTLHQRSHASDASGHRSRPPALLQCLTAASLSVELAMQRQKWAAGSAPSAVAIAADRKEPPLSMAASAVNSAVTAPELRLVALVVLGAALRLAVLWLAADTLSQRIEWSLGRSRLKQRPTRTTHFSQSTQPATEQPASTTAPAAAARPSHTSPPIWCCLVLCVCVLRRSVLECSYWYGSEMDWSATGSVSTASMSAPVALSTPAAGAVECSPLLLLLSLPLSSAASLLSLPSPVAWLVYCAVYVGCDVLVALQLRSARL